MSSSALPTLVIDLTARRGERRVALAGCVLAVCSALQWNLPPGGGILVAACVLFTVAMGFRQTGWFGGRHRLVRIACRSDGGWVLWDAGGRAIHTQLSAASRVSAHALWLRWQAENGPPLLILPGDIPATHFRRLVVRLRCEFPGSSHRARA